MISTGMVATVGDARQYHKGRRMAAAIGITPKRHSSGGKDRLLGIGIRGDVYLRTLMIHGARAVVTKARHRDERLSRWVCGIATRQHPNVAAVALANKTARCWWKRSLSFDRIGHSLSDQIPTSSDRHRLRLL